MLRLITATCYGLALLLTIISVPGFFIVERGHEVVVAGWLFCTAGLFAIGRLAHLARGKDQV